MTKSSTKIITISEPKAPFKAELLKLQLSYDRGLMLPKLWPNLSRDRLTDPDVLWRRDPQLALAVAGMNRSTMGELLEVLRRRASQSKDYEIDFHALALRAYSAETLILAIACRHETPPFAVASMSARLPATG